MVLITGISRPKQWYEPFFGPFFVLSWWGCHLRNSGLSSSIVIVFCCSCSCIHVSIIYMKIIIIENLQPKKGHCHVPVVVMLPSCALYTHHVWVTTYNLKELISGGKRIKGEKNLPTTQEKVSWAIFCDAVAIQTIKWIPPLCICGWKGLVARVKIMIHRSSSCWWGGDGGCLSSLPWF